MCRGLSASVFCRDEESHVTPWGLFIKRRDQGQLTGTAFITETKDQEASEVIGFTGTAVLPGNSVTGARHINTQAHGTLFICSSLGNHNDSIGPTGASTIARKVTVDQPPGGAIHDFHSLPYDYITLEPQSISGLTFRVTDWAGRTVPMGHWSLSIIIVPEEDF